MAILAAWGTISEYNKPFGKLSKNLKQKKTKQIMNVFIGRANVDVTVTVTLQDRLRLMARKKSIKN